jgi:hypothetical protein
MEEGTNFNEMQGKFDSIKESDDFEQLPLNEKVNVIFLSTLKKLEILDNHIRQFVDDDDKANYQLMDQLFSKIRDDLIEVAVEVQDNNK